MAPVEPIHCRRTAFELMAECAGRLHSTDSLVMGAVAIAMHEMPEVSVEAVERSLDSIANDIRARFHGDSPHATLAHAHAVLFDEMRFSGVMGANEPLDSYLPAVIERHRGLPISLSLIYKLVLERLGLAVHGLNTPGHFLVGVELQGSVMIVDAASFGRVMSMPEVVKLVLERTQSQRLPVNNPLPVASHRDWLQRMLRNLMGVFGTRNRPTECAAMVELKTLLDG